MSGSTSSRFYDVSILFYDKGEPDSWEQRTLAAVPHISGAMSMLGSGWIILDIIKDRKKKGTVYHRLVFCMSCFDFLSSFWLMLSTIPVPEGTHYVHGAAGTTATCSAQGFFLQLNIATPLYNMYLSLYYLLLLRFNWTEGRIKREAEPYMHAVAISYALGSAVVGLALELYNPALWCTIAPFPLDCNQGFNNGGVSDCIRGDNASVYMFALFFAELWVSILISAVSLVLVYGRVLGLEKAVERYQLHHRIRHRSSSTTAAASSDDSDGGRRRRFDKSKRRRRSLSVANLSMLYMAAFIITWLFPTIAACTFSITGEAAFAISLLRAICLPLQGFFNFFIYVRPRYQRYRIQNPDISLFGVFGQVLRRTMDLCNTYDDDDYKLGTGFDDDEEDEEVDGEREGNTEDSRCSPSLPYPAPEASAKESSCAEVQGHLTKERNSNDGYRSKSCPL